MQSVIEVMLIAQESILREPEVKWIEFSEDTTKGVFFNYTGTRIDLSVQQYMRQHETCNGQQTDLSLLYSLPKSEKIVIRIQ